MSPTAVPADFYATALSILSSNASVTVAGSSGRPEVHPAVYLYGFCLVLIPTATILGNLLVIMSVLRFKALHSAINFLILGLAVADLLVAVSVMPYAVYIYVQGGSWYLGPLMCDIYSAFDVACSTASILLLAVISFDRYRAVSRPIQYSRQSQNIRRVVMIIIIIWVISLALASPMVLGVNNRPADANPHECRFYNPEFSIGSSIVSFVIPCFVVLFVYIRIMMALRKREMAARARRQANQASEGNKSYDGSDEAGQIVAGPDDHDLAGSSSPHSSTDSLSENVHVVTNDFVSEGPTSMSRRSSDFDSSFANNTVSSLNSSNLLDKSDRSGVSDEKRYRRGFRQTPGFGRRSFTMPSMGQNTVKRRNTTGLREPFLPNFLRQLSRRSPRIFRRVDAYPCKAYTIGGNHHMAEVIENCDTATPVKKALYRSGEATDDDETDKFLIVTTPNGVPQANECQSTRTSQGSAVSSSPNSTLNAIIRRSVTTNDAAEIEDKHEAPTATIDEDFEGTDVEDFEDGPDVSLATTSASGRVGLVIANQAASDVSPVHRVENKRIRNLAPKAETDSPSVSFNIAGKTFFGGRSHHHSEGNSSLPPISTMRRRSSCAENLSESNKLSGGGDSCGITSSVSSNVISSGENGSKKQAKRHPKHMKSQYSMDSFGSTAAPSISSGGKGSETRKKHNHAKLNGSSTALAVRIVKKTINRKESSLKRKVTKAQRKERRATKTLGIVVGIFLICWVPFFSINILNAICVRLENEACQIGFGPFFYTTWIGYMNSFMNPIIYTIFNTEFRRAFKSLILGRNAARRHNRAHNV